MRTLHWFRNDLRLVDNTALTAAAQTSSSVVPVYVLDVALLGHAWTGAPRMRFLLDCLDRLAQELERRQSGLIVTQGKPVDVIPRLAAELSVEQVTWNRDDSPFARRRDARVERALRDAGHEVRTFKDRVIFEAPEVRTQGGAAFRVYTPYRRAWWRLYQDAPPSMAAPLRLPPLPDGVKADVVPDAAALGFGADTTEIPTGGNEAARRRLRAFLDGPVRDYATQRDLPAVDGTSRLSPYLRLGAISVRQCVAEAHALANSDPESAEGATKWIDELVWRDFYAAILHESPHVLRGAYRTEYDALEWENDPAAFEAWCAGRTGYPFVDAGMRQLAASGWMHNRVRMLVASFLTKDLGIDWRDGERFFMQRLVDGDPASNNGGWQWSASTGTDAQPYFRIFNPVTQGERYDPDGEYIARWVPELRGLPPKLIHQPWRSPLETADYPPRMVDHAERRERTLRRYKRVRAASARG
jgi:deoxyribodipyrimidine photo-lyase